MSNKQNESVAADADYSREFRAPVRDTVFDRFLSIMSSPSEVFRRLGDKHGWFAPIAIVLAMAMLQAIVQVSMTDLDGWQKAQMEQGLERMSSYQRRQFDKLPENDRMVGQRMQTFMLKLGLFVWPWFGAFFGVLFFGGVLMLASWAGKGAIDFRLSCVVTAHAMMIDALQSIALAIVAALTRDPMPVSNLSRLADPFQAPVAAAALGWIDPFTMAFAFLLSLGAIHTLRVQKPGRAIAVILAVFALGIAIQLGLAAASASFMNFGMKG